MVNNSICYSNGKFVAVGHTGLYMHSENGTEFTSGTIDGDNTWNSICYGNGKFVAVGHNGALAYSDNGTTFDKGTIDGGNTWNSICYSNGKSGIQFVIVMVNSLLLVIMVH